MKISQNRYEHTADSCEHVEDGYDLVTNRFVCLCLGTVGFVAQKVCLLSVLCTFNLRFWCVHGFSRPTATLTPKLQYRTAQRSCLCFVLFYVASPCTIVVRSTLVLIVLINIVGVVTMKVLSTLLYCCHTCWLNNGRERGRHRGRTHSALIFILGAWKKLEHERPSRQHQQVHNLFLNKKHPPTNRSITALCYCCWLRNVSHRASYRRALKCRHPTKTIIYSWYQVVRCFFFLRVFVPR